MKTPSLFCKTQLALLTAALLMALGSASAPQAAAESATGEPVEKVGATADDRATQGDVANTKPSNADADTGTGEDTDNPDADAATESMALSKEVLTALEKAGNRFTPEVKAAYLAQRKSQALAEIAKAGYTLPADFLAWVDADPVVAATVYGLTNPRSRFTGRHNEYTQRVMVSNWSKTKHVKRAIMTTDTPAQRLAFLRSLEIDLGAEELRQKHTQLLLAFTHFRAGSVDTTTMANDAMKVSLKPRGLFKLEIPGDPRVRVDTRAKDRRLDINDHIINFCEDNPITFDKKVVTTVDGEKVVNIEKVTRPPHAYEVYGNPEMMKKFNAYMTGRGFPMNLRGGPVNPWTRGLDVIKAYKMFRTAYEEKGLMPKRNDPHPLPVELAAYLIRNDNHRFPEGVKRSWPKFNLNSPWPILQWLVTSGESLREREYAWDIFCKRGGLVSYGAYIGDIAQYIDFVKARKLQPFAFYYDTYPMRLKDGGVCGTCSNVGRFANLALGIPSAQAGQPGHSCLVRIGGNEKSGFTIGVEQSYKNPTSINGFGRLELAVAQLTLPVNYGLLPMLDSKIAMQLAASVPAKDKKALFLSAFAANPYNHEAALACLNAQENPRQLIEIWQMIKDTLAKVDKPGCPKGYNPIVIKPTFDARLTQLPLPTHKADVEFVAANLADRSDALWLKYQLAQFPLPALKDRMAAGLKASIAGTRTPQSTTELSMRLERVGKGITDIAERKAWGSQLLSIIGDNSMFTVGEAKRAREYTDACVDTARTMVGNSPDVRLEFVKSLQAAVEGTRTPAACNLMVKRLSAISRDFKRSKEKTAFANALLEVVNGHETFALPNRKIIFDPIVREIYALGCDLTPAKERVAADLKAAVEGTRTPTSASLLNQRLVLISRYVRHPKQREEFAETLLGIINGRETFAPNPKLPTRLMLDPCVSAIYALGPDLTIAKTKCEADLKASAADARTPDATGILAQRLSTILRARSEAKTVKAWAETLLPIFAGKEFYTFTVTLPKNKGVKTSEHADPCAALIYRTLKKKMPIPEKPAEET